MLVSVAELAAKLVHQHHAFDAARFFVRPPRHVPIQKRRARMPLFRPTDGVCEDLRFESRLPADIRRLLDRLRTDRGGR